MKVMGMWKVTPKRTVIVFIIYKVPGIWAIPCHGEAMGRCRLAELPEGIQILLPKQGWISVLKMSLHAGQTYNPPKGKKNWKENQGKGYCRLLTAKEAGSSTCCQGKLAPAPLHLQPCGVRAGSGTQSTGAVAPLLTGQAVRRMAREGEKTY